MSALRDVDPARTPGPDSMSAESLVGVSVRAAADAAAARAPPPERAEGAPAPPWGRSALRWGWLGPALRTKLAPFAGLRAG